MHYGVNNWGKTGEQDLDLCPPFKKFHQNLLITILHTDRPQDVKVLTHTVFVHYILTMLQLFFTN